MLETALVTPLVLVVLLGILEFGLVYRDYQTISDGTTDAARIGSIVGPDRGQAGGQFVTADFLMMQRIRQASGTLSPEAFERIVFFNAAAPSMGSPEAQIPDSCRNGSDGVEDVCNVYADPADAFRRIEEGDHEYFDCSEDPSSPACAWDPLERVDGPDPVDVDYLGVWIEFTHPSVTGLFGDFDLSSGQITRLEPGSTVR